MKKILTIIALILFVITINRCKNQENKPINEQIVQKIVKVDSNRMIFLSYWIGMPLNEVFKHTSDLLNNGSIRQMGKDSFYYSFVFEDREEKALLKFDFDSTSLVSLDLDFTGDISGNIVNQKILDCEKKKETSYRDCVEEITYIGSGSDITKLYFNKYKLLNSFTDTRDVIYEKYRGIQGLADLDPIDPNSKYGGCPIVYEFLNKETIIVMMVVYKKVRIPTWGSSKVQVFEKVSQLLVSYNDKQTYLHSKELYNEKIKQDSLREIEEKKKVNEKKYKDI